MMQGKIWVESKEGVGSNFQFTARFGLQEGEASSRRIVMTELGDLHVLIIDDNASAREIMSSMLNSFGLQTEQADNGEKALKMLKEVDANNPFSLILMDWKIPKMDGVEITQILQSDVDIKNQPRIIMVTAYGKEDVERAAQDINLSHILTKPVTPSQLHDAIMLAMGHKVIDTARKGSRHQDFDQAISHLRGARVLLVEDNEINQELAMELLSSNDILVEVAGDGQQALDMLLDNQLHHPFDGVLMDCQMPVMDGYEATQKLRELPQFKDLPILAMTANAMAGDREKVLDAGMNDHIAKPININDMFNVMSNWITPSRPLDSKPDSSINQFSESHTDFEIPEMSGIDTASGLATCQNNNKLYHKLLLKFRDHEADFQQRFQAAQNDSDSSSATRCAHTLKGVAANIGARAVQKSAEALESACKEARSSEIIDEQLAIVINHLSKVLDALTVLSSQSSSDSDADGTLDTEFFKSLVLQLKALLEDDNVEAGEVVAELEALPGINEYRMTLKSLSKAISGYDFEEALKVLVTLLSKV